jgi:hypothetical protein
LNGADVEVTGATLTGGSAAGTFTLASNGASSKLQLSANAAVQASFESAGAGFNFADLYWSNANPRILINSQDSIFTVLGSNSPSQSSNLLNLQNSDTNPRASVSRYGFYIQPTQTLTVADNGGGTAATANLTPTSSNILCTCNDANGCTVTILESGTDIAAGPQIIHIISTTANTCNIDDINGQVEAVSDPLPLTQNDSVIFWYITGAWMQHTAVLAL